MSMNKILVLGGAGYVGSHTVRMLVSKGFNVVVFDNLSTGHDWSISDAKFIEGDILNVSSLFSLFEREGKFDLIMHFCARSLVGESVDSPELYYINNVSGTLNVLRVMMETGHDKLVFSSTASIYGMPQAEFVDENHPKQPINPYGLSKWMVEQILVDFYRAYGLSSVSLRYFNAAGADVSGEIGEAHNPETHLIPNILLSVLGKSGPLKVFGNRYPTKDGSCIRDFVHVNDLSVAHLLAGDYMNKNPGAHAFNLGSGRGFSVFEIIAAAAEVVGCDIPYKLEAPRRGDPAVLVADASLARKELGWEPQYEEIKDIIESAWKWHSKVRLS